MKKILFLPNIRLLWGSNDEICLEPPAKAKYNLKPVTNQKQKQASNKSIVNIHGIVIHPIRIH